MRKSEISVVIPCYNEEENIFACLQALQEQTLKPLEIIVVDNNSTDETAKIAAQFDNVTVEKEIRQGVTAASKRGFLSAEGKIFARLDADSRPRANWLEVIEKTFDINSQIQAVTGSGFFYDAPCKHFVRAYRNLIAVWLNRYVMGHHMLWGSNMAIRKSAWLAIKKEVCNRPNIMEDLDIAAHINKKFGPKSIYYDREVHVDVSARRAMVSLKNNYLYLAMWPRTLKLHGYQKGNMLWLAIAALLASIAFGNKIARFYNYQEDRFIFSLTQWRSNGLYNRSNP